MQKHLKLFDEAFDYKKSLKIAQITHEDVINLRKKVENNKNIPKDFPNRLVSFKNVN